ncbi:hypothetical protein GC177_01130 [bacterium]|nr:hypothetical protein [bacterium]
MTVGQRHAWWLWRLRWVFLLLEAGVIALGTVVLELPLPLAPLCWLMLLQLLQNIATGYALRMRKDAEPHLLLQLCADMFLLAAMLYFTGGAANPFASLFVIQVMVAATILPLRQAWAAALLSVALYSLLMVYKQDVSYLQHHHLGQAFSLHIYGMWLNFIILATVVAGMVGRMAQVIQRQQAALADAQAQAIADEQVVMLGALAAGTAHELGTPVNTAMLLAEQAQALSKSSEIKAVIKRIMPQLERIAAVIHRLAGTAGEYQSQAGEVTIQELIDTATGQWRSLRPQAIMQVRTGETSPCHIRHDPMLIQILVTFLNNAADADATEAHIEVDAQDGMIELRVCDNGSGVSPDFMVGLGASTKPEGRGIGLWLANHYALRAGGKIGLVPADGRGSVASICLPKTGRM